MSFDDPFAAWWATHRTCGNYEGGCRAAFDGGRSSALAMLESTLADLQRNRDYWRACVEKKRAERHARDRNCGHGHDRCSSAICFVALDAGRDAAALPAWLDAAPQFDDCSRLTNPADVPPLARLADRANGYGGQGTRALHCLANLFGGVVPGSRTPPRTLRDLVAWSHLDLLKVRNMGPKALRRLVGAFAACGVTWPEGGLR